MRSASVILVLAAAALALPGPVRADVESDLRRQWQGTFVVTREPMASECTDHFTDNGVAGGRVNGGAGSRFGAGEIANVDKVDVTWTRIDVSLTFAEPFRVSWKDGPYTLYDQRRCRVQLKMELPSKVRKDTAQANAAIGAVLEPFPSEAAARRAPGFNKRHVEAYPADYDRTRAEYEVWRAAHINAKVQERIDSLLREGQDLIDRGRDDEEYQQCFGKGVRSRSYQSFGDCDTLLDSYFSSSGSCAKDQRGFDDGQRLAWTLGMVRALSACFVAAPTGGGH